MTLLGRLSACFVLTSLFCFSTNAQSQNEIRRFSKDGLAFDYLSSWDVVDSTGSENRQITLTRRGSSVQITVVVKRDLTRLSELPFFMDRFRDTLVKNATSALGASAAKFKSISIRTRVRDVEADGVRLNSPTKTGARLSDVVWLRTKLRLVGLTFSRLDKDELHGSKMWEVVRGSFTLDPPIVGVLPVDHAEHPGQIFESGVLNGRALALPQPPYPAIARQAGASGSVQVQVLIDEFGNVIDAHAVSGPPLLLAVCKQAALKSKFSPTRLDDEPVRVTGVIVYNFVAR